MITEPSTRVVELADQISSRVLRSETVVQASLQAIEQSQGLNAFIHTSTEAALAAARLTDELLDEGQPPGALSGVPIAVKDALCTLDAPTTCASRILNRQAKTSPPMEGWQAPYDATVIERLRSAGAILVGKTNMDEFAMGSSNENSAFGPARNPWDPEHIPGGSSGGSAVAVAGGMVPGALGSDTGGSVRQPAALCGVVGVKPSYGRVSRYGLIAFASSLDQVGPFASDVRGAARLLEVIAGVDPKDATCSELPVGNYVAACDRSVEGLRVGLPPEYFGKGLDPEVASSVRQAVEKLKQAGCSIRPVSLPHTRYGIATYYIIATAEASSNLSRFDGVRFGLREEPGDADLATLYGATRDLGFGAEVKRRIMLGTYVLSSGYYDAYYLKAQRARTLIRRDFEHVFNEVDVLVTPTSPMCAPRIGANQDDPLVMYLADIYTLPASLAGICGLSVPCGLTQGSKARPPLPIGLQVLAPAFSEERLFQVGSTCEQLLEFPGISASPSPRHAP